MATIDNKQAVKFSPQRLRPVANSVGKLYRTLKQFQLDVVTFEALTSENVDGDAIGDDAEDNGRAIATKLTVAQVKFVVGQVVDCLETDDRLEIINRIADDTQPAF